MLNYELKLAVNQVSPCLRLRSGTAAVVERSRNHNLQGWTLLTDDFNHWCKKTKYNNNYFALLIMADVVINLIFFIYFITFFYRLKMRFISLFLHHFDTKMFLFCVILRFCTFVFSFVILIFCCKNLRIFSVRVIFGNWFWNKHIL